MGGEMNLSQLIKEMTPKLNNGEFVFCNNEKVSKIDRNNVICKF